MRALSALAVVLFHMGWLWCGWLGVWAFFTISGFVITRSFVKAQATGDSISPLQFYGRRAARILPLYLTVIAAGAVALLVAALLFEDVEGLVFLRDLPWLLTGTYNVFRAMPGYEETRFFGHLWSISVEEQFYLLFPLAILGLKRAAFFAMLIILVALGPLVRAASHLAFTSLGWTASDVASAVYQLTFNHFDAFALGSLIALREESLRALANTPLAPRLNWLVPVGLGGLALVCVVLQNLQVPLTGKDVLTNAFAVKPELLSSQTLVYALGSFGAAGLLVLILTGSRLVSFLASDSLVRLGAISFGIYLWHYPLLWIFSEVGHRSLVSAGLPWWLRC